MNAVVMWVSLDNFINLKKKTGTIPRFCNSFFHSFKCIEMNGRKQQQTRLFLGKFQEINWETGKWSASSERRTSHIESLSSRWCFTLHLYYHLDAASMHFLLIDNLSYLLVERVSTRSREIINFNTFIAFWSCYF